MASDPEGSRTYTLEIGEKRYRLKRSQLTTAVIGRLFGLQLHVLSTVEDYGPVSVCVAVLECGLLYIAICCASQR